MLGRNRMLPSSRRKWQWLLYVWLPLALAIACLGGIAFWLLDNQPAPVVAAIDFDVDATGDFARAAEQITYLRMAQHRGAAAELLPSTDTGLFVEVNDCESQAEVTLSVYPDPRWWLALRASRRGVPQVLALQRGTNAPAVISPGSVEGRASAAIPGDLEDVEVFIPRGEDRIPVRATTELLEGSPEEFTRVEFRIPDRALDDVLLRSVIGQYISLTFKAPWVHPGGFRRCYVALPALIEGEASSLAGMGAEGLAVHSAASVAGRGPFTGTTRLFISGGSAVSSESRPPPQRAAITPTWTCHRRQRISQLTGPDCHSSALIDEPHREAWQQVLLLILGAVGSAGVLGVLDGMRRKIVPPG